MDSASLVYFGYGSLVNRDTRPATEWAVSARLHGWRRVWEHQGSLGGRRSCALSVEPASMDEGIDGVLVRLPLVDLPQLDERETGYDRLMLPGADFELAPAADDDELRMRLGSMQVAVYRSHSDCRGRATTQAPLLQSYVDCVMAGYLKRFGETGLQDFLHSTVGWDAPLELDRAAPRYPRAVSLDTGVAQRFDQLLAAIR